MTQFWIYVAGLIILAMAFIVLPLLRKRFHTGISADELNLSVFKQQLAELDSDLEAGNLDQQRYEAAKKDLEKELLSDITSDQAKAAEATQRDGRWLALGALAVPIVAFLLYQTLGSPEIIQRLKEPPMTAAANDTSPHAQNPDMKGLPPMEELVKRLAEKMAQNPDNQEGWIMLGRSYMAMKQFPEAMDAYDRAMKINGENVSLLLAYAEAIAAMNGNDFTGRPAPLVEKAFALEPENPNTLWLAGIVAYQQGNFQDALTRWEKLQSKLPPQSNELESINSAIDDARSQLGLAPQEAPLPQIASAQPKSEMQPAAQTANSAIEVNISLSPELSAKAKPGDLLFIYAKALSGPPMPLAAVRKRVGDLPLTLRLDDSMAMMPQMKLSSFPKVVVGARISLSGGPTAQSGDLEGEVKPVTPGQSEPVSVVINAIHP